SCSKRSSASDRERHATHDRRRTSETTTREFSVVSSACAVPCRWFFANHFAGRFARFVPNSTVGSTFAGLRAEILCTSCSVCLTHRCGRFCGRTRLTRWPHSLQSRKNQTHRKPIYNRRFRAVEKISCAALRNRAAQHIARFARAPQVARDGAGAG